MYELGQIVSFTPTAYKEGYGAHSRRYEKVRGTVAEINEEHRWYRLTYQLECGWEQSECFKF